jgi:hypothetical protein
VGALSREAAAVRRLSEFGEFASRFYSAGGGGVELFCAQSGAAGLASAGRHGLSEEVEGYCFDPLEPGSRRASRVRACSLLLYAAPGGDGVSVVGARQEAAGVSGEVCVYPGFGSGAPSVFAAEVSAGGETGLAVIPEGALLGGGFLEGAGVA